MLDWLTYRDKFCGCLAYYLSLKLEAVGPSETSGSYANWLIYRDKFCACLAYYLSLKLEVVGPSEKSECYARLIILQR